MSEQAWKVFDCTMLSFIAVLIVFLLSNAFDDTKKYQVLRVEATEAPKCFAVTDKTVQTFTCPPFLDQLPKEP